MYNDLYLLARIVEHTPLNIIITDLDGRITYVNRFCQQTLGRDRGTLRDQPVGPLFSPAAEGPAWPAIARKLAEGGTFLCRLNVVAKDGDENLCDLAAFRIEGTAESPSAFVVTFRGVGQEVKYAEQIERSNVEMAKMNTELGRSNAELLRVSEMKSNFLSIASHELKTPLTSIKGYSDIIIDTMKDKLDAATFKMVESINRAADRLHRVVNNILDVTRIEQKRLKLRPEELDLAEVAAGCIEDLTQFSQKRGIVFECRVDKSLPSFFGDKMRIQNRGMR